MLEKDKNCIEFLMRSMIIAQKPYQEDIEIEVTGMIPGREILTADNSFDVPCEVVMVPKREFERLQTENEELKKKLHEFDPMPESKDLLKRLYSIDDVDELEWVLKHTCGGMCSANGWRAISLFWKKKYETLSKLVGFSSVEEIEDYLVNEAEADTLHEAITTLEYSVKYARDERRDLSKKLEECEKDYISERDRAEALQKEIGVYSRTLKEWKDGTGCPSPSAAKTMIECQTSWHHAYEDAKKKIESLEAALRESNSTMTKELEQEIGEWQKATGRISPEEAKQYIGRLKSRLNLIHNHSVDW